MKRPARLAAAGFAGLLALPVLALALLLTFDWNRARPWLNARTSEAIGRPFAIRGDLSLHWDRQGTAAQGWRARLPWPHFVAQDIHVGNPPSATADAGDMASIGQVDFSLNPFALPDRRIVIPQLRLQAPAVELRRAADGSNNWTFTQEDKPSAWRLDLHSIVFSQGRAHLVDAIRRADVHAGLDTIDTPAAPGAPAYGVAWQLHGTVNGEALRGAGKAGAVLSLQQQGRPYPFMAELRMGPTRIAVEGTATRPTQLAALDMRLSMSGPSMARLYALSGIVLPETPAFSTEGRLAGTLGAHGSRWHYDKFSGKVGASDIGGSLVYETGAARDRLSGTVVSRLLRFADLAPVIGADSNASKRARGVAIVQPADKLLPVEPFRTERWTSIDADIAFDAEKILRDKALPINRLSTKLRLHDGVLVLEPLDFSVAGGTLNANVTLDGSGRSEKEAIKARMKIRARHLKLKQLFPDLQEMHASVGEINGDASLSATGNSIASLLGAANGEVRTLMDRGTVSKLLLEEMGLNIGSVIVTRLVGDRPVKIHCMATDFAVRDGQMQARSVIVDTEDALIGVEGSINLAREQFDLTIRPDSRGIRVFSLRAPLYVRGSFKSPQVSIDKGVMAMRAGSALALAALAPLAALIPLVSTGPGTDSACATLMSQARTAPVAPPPGQSYRPAAPRK